MDASRRRRARAFTSAFTSSVAALAAFAAIATSPREASAFCRTSSCPDVGTSTMCVPAQSSDCGLPIFWPGPCVGYTLQKDASSEVSLEDAAEVFDKAFDAWTSALCPGGGTPRMAVEYMGSVECDQHEYNQSEKLGNSNIIIFRDVKWPHAGAGSTLALTTVTYNIESGEIYDADMEINSAGVKLTTGDTGVEFDLQSIATHETGHFLGLSHTPVKDATMVTEYAPGSMDLRDLSDDDRAGICAVYPPGAPVPDTCDATPRHGFSSLCSDQVGQDDENGGCCSVAPGAPSSDPARAAGLLALGAAVLAARRPWRRRAEARAEVKASRGDPGPARPSRAPSGRA